MRNEDGAKNIGNTSYLDKLIYKFTIGLLLSILGSGILVVLVALVMPYSDISKVYIVGEIFVMFLVLYLVSIKLKLKFFSLFLNGIPLAFIIGFTLNLSPNIFSENYVIVENSQSESGFCLKTCFSEKKTKEMPSIYSWRYSKLKRVSSYRSDCCFNEQYDNTLLFPILTVLEVTGQILIFTLSFLFLALLYEYYSGTELERFFYKDALSEGLSSPRKINTLGICLMATVILYNLSYSGGIL